MKKVKSNFSVRSIGNIWAVVCQHESTGEIHVDIVCKTRAEAQKKIAFLNLFPEPLFFKRKAIQFSPVIPEVAR